MGLLGSMTVRFGADTSGLNAGIKTASNLLSQLGSGNFAGAAVTGLGLIAGAAIGIGVSSVKAAADFQQSMLKVSAYAGLSKSQMDDMSNSILTMASQLGQSPKAMADAIYPIISSGYSASQALDILQLSAKTAAASGADMSVVADALTTSLKSMHAPASQAGNYMDMINKIVSLGKGNVSDYAATIGKLSLAAGSAHVPFDQMGAALATLTTHGFPSVAQASTSLGNLFTQIGPKVDLVAQHAKKLGLAFDENKFKTLDLAGQLKYLQTVTGGNQGELLKLLGGSTLALKAFNALSGSTKDFTSNLQAMKNATGSTDAAFKTASSGFNASMARMHASVEVLQVKIGTALLPAITKITDKIAPLVAQFADWLVKSNLIPNVINDIVSTVQTLTTDAGILVTNIQNVINFFGQNQIAGDALFATLSGIATILGILAISAVIDFIATLPAMIAGFIAWAATAGAAAIATIAATWPLLLLGAVVAAVVLGVILAIQHWGAITQWFSNLWHTVWSAVSSFFVGLWKNIVDGVNHGLDGIGKAIQAAGSWFYSTFVSPFQNAWHTISGIFGNIGAGIAALASGNIPGALHDFGIPGFASGVRNFRGGLALVGERGPEIVQLPQGTNVFPSVSSMSSSAASAGGGFSGSAPSSGDQHIYIELDGEVLTHVVSSRQAQKVRLRMGRRAA